MQMVEEERRLQMVFAPTHNPIDASATQRVGLGRMPTNPQQTGATYHFYCFNILTIFI